MRLLDNFLAERRRLYNEYWYIAAVEREAKMLVEELRVRRDVPNAGSMLDLPHLREAMWRVDKPKDDFGL